jgi:trypsin
MIAKCSKLATIGVLFMIISVSQSSNLRGQYQRELQEIERELQQIDMLEETGLFDFDESNVVQLEMQTEDDGMEIPEDFSQVSPEDKFAGEGSTARIVGGFDAEYSSEAIPNSYAAILYTTSDGGHSFSNCGATLITVCHLATAAHCVGRGGVNNVAYINARQMYNAENKNGGNVYHWSNIIGETSHPSYVSWGKDNDVAIFTLETCVPSSAVFDGGIKIAPLGNDGACKSSEGLLVAGYGRLTQDSSAKPDVLQAVQVNYMDNCDQYYSGSITSNMICAGVPEGGKDSCQGDSGGPMFSTSGLLCGIVSWGSGCAQAGKPGVYANPYVYTSWFQSQCCGDSRLTGYSSSLCGERRPSLPPQNGQ